jgi:hypothetical protein
MEQPRQDHSQGRLRVASTEAQAFEMRALDLPEEEV